jgi:hypothetical protein
LKDFNPCFNKTGQFIFVGFSRHAVKQPLRIQLLEILDEISTHLRPFNFIIGQSEFKMPVKTPK